MTDWKKIRAKLLKTRGELCECGCCRKWTDLHHILIHRMTGHPELDDERNLVCLARPCHMDGKFNAWEERVKFWDVQCKRYGEAHMREWLESLPLKVKPRF